ncbi:hypothetical protein ZWY2020_053981 [Hordeum vulgare]|nr:hypothetical protein ZWY2020_053981 [Hordeum vulgare]
MRDTLFHWPATHQRFPRTGGSAQMGGGPWAPGGQERQSCVGWDNGRRRVYADGSICLDILQNQWSPIYDVAAILTSIQDDLKHPEEALYTEKAKELNGEDYDILKNDVCSKALYDCSNGKPHHTWSLFNGIVNDIEVISEVRATGTSSAALKRRRAEEIEDVRQKETQKTRKGEAYANSVLSWGVGMYELCNEIQKFFKEHVTAASVPAVDDEGILGDFSVSLELVH